MNKIHWTALLEQHDKATKEMKEQEQEYINTCKKGGRKLGLDDLKRRIECEYATRMVIEYLRKHQEYVQDESDKVVGTPLIPMLAVHKAYVDTESPQVLGCSLEELLPKFEARHEIHTTTTELLYSYLVGKYTEAEFHAETVKRLRQLEKSME